MNFSHTKTRKTTRKIMQFFFINCGFSSTAITVSFFYPLQSWHHHYGSNSFLYIKWYRNFLSPFLSSMYYILVFFGFLEEKGIVLSTLFDHSFWKSFEQDWLCDSFIHFHFCIIIKSPFILLPWQSILKFQNIPSVLFSLYSTSSGLKICWKDTQF